MEISGIVLASFHMNFSFIYMNRVLSLKKSNNKHKSFLCVNCMGIMRLPAPPSAVAPAVQPACASPPTK